jgi:hypothetical protein
MTRSAETPRPGIYLAAAVFCERILRERDDVLSLIRVVNTFTMQVRGKNLPTEMPKALPPLEATAFLAFNCEEAGRHRIDLVTTSPSGKRSPSHSLDINADGDGKVENAILTFRMTVDMPGLFWVDVAIDGVNVTRMPMHIRYEPIEDESG